MPIYRMLYVSGATRPMSPADLDAILAASRRNNEALDVTGLLLWAEGAFIQVLEGEADVVKRLAARIRNDNRHRNFMVLVEQESAERAFGRWSMGFKRLEPGQTESDALFRTTAAALANRVAETDKDMMLDVILAFAADFIEGGKGG
jgi:hypothetical protein